MDLKQFVESHDVTIALVVRLVVCALACIFVSGLEAPVVMLYHILLIILNKMAGMVFFQGCLFLACSIYIGLYFSCSR